MLEMNSSDIVFGFLFYNVDYLCSQCEHFFSEWYRKSECSFSSITSSSGTIAAKMNFFTIDISSGNSADSTYYILCFLDYICLREVAR